MAPALLPALAAAAPPAAAEVLARAKAAQGCREAPAGTRLKLRVRSAGGEREVVLALRELV